MLIRHSFFDKKYFGQKEDEINYLAVIEKHQLQRLHTTISQRIARIHASNTSIEALPSNTQIMDDIHSETQPFYYEPPDARYNVFLFHKNDVFTYKFFFLVLSQLIFTKPKCIVFFLYSASVALRDSLFGADSQKQT